MRKIKFILPICCVLILFTSCTANVPDTNRLDTEAITVDSTVTTTVEITEGIAESVSTTDPIELSDDVRVAIESLTDVTKITIEHSPSDKIKVITDQCDIQAILDFIKTVQVVRLDDPNDWSNGAAETFTVEYGENKIFEIYWGSNTCVRINRVLYEIVEHKDINKCFENLNTFGAPFFVP